jgi:hypothetical protein
MMETSSTDKRLDDFSDRQGRFEENVDQRFDRFEGRVDKRFEEVDKRFDRFEGQVDRRFDAVDRRFDAVDGRFERFEDKVDRRFDKVDADGKENFAKSQVAIGSLSEQFDKMNRRLMGGLITIVGAVILKVFTS